MQPCPGCARPLHLDATGCPFCATTIRHARAPLPQVLGMIALFGLAACGDDGDTSGSATETGSASTTMTTGMSASSTVSTTNATTASTGMSASATQTTTTEGTTDDTVTDTAETSGTTGSTSSEGTGTSGDTTVDPSMSETALPPYGSPLPRARWA